MNVMVQFIIYFLFFAVIHSLLAMDRTKKKAEKLLGKNFRYYRLAYSIASIPLFVPAFQIWLKYARYTPIIYSIPDILYPAIIIIRLIGLGFFGYAALQIDFLEFIGIKPQKKIALIKKGAYGIARHPLYAALILLLITKTEMSLLDITAVLLISGYFVIGAFIEERRLLSTLGDEYREYQKRVSMFIPFKWLKGKFKKS